MLFFLVDTIIAGQNPVMARIVGRLTLKFMTGNCYVVADISEFGTFHFTKVLLKVELGTNQSQNNYSNLSYERK
jgi:hypothetical protein